MCVVTRFVPSFLKALLCVDPQAKVAVFGLPFLRRRAQPLTRLGCLTQIETVNSLATLRSSRRSSSTALEPCERCLQDLDTIPYHGFAQLAYNLPTWKPISFITRPYHGFVQLAPSLPAFQQSNTNPGRTSPGSPAGPKSCFVRCQESRFTS